MDVLDKINLKEIDISNPREIRNLLGQFATGVTVITTRGTDGRKVGMTANSFSSLSLDPPLVLWSLSKTAPSLPDFVAAEHFAVHMLTKEQHQLSTHFARGAQDKFATVDHGECDTGVPLLNEALATLVCKNVQQYEGGDHLIFIGEIQKYQQTAGEPLVFHAGRYQIAASHPDL
ncbi:flavin reductase [Acinetobacter johnsonii]|uniref:Flavin reductase n=1 Tax=Acinetobacter johnsonii TaxID=40214 RepID=A0A3Q8XFG5_ACIJO|nr:flavin reductase family protein [Acinetobacter johnsonii]AZN65153.1 flavin reductase [Acinetobacter johnsonii]